MIYTDSCRKTFKDTVCKTNKISRTHPDYSSVNQTNNKKRKKKKKGAGFGKGVVSPHAGVVNSTLIM